MWIVGDTHEYLYELNFLRLKYSEKKQRHKGDFHLEHFLNSSCNLMCVYMYVCIYIYIHPRIHWKKQKHLHKVKDKMEQK